METNKEPQTQYLLIILGIALYVIVTVGFVFFGRVNADEGWYLYAGRLVYEGQLPYQDFAYTQTPLLPYVYGGFITLFPSLYTGRIVTALFSIGALLGGLWTANRYAGAKASLITVLSGVTFIHGIYFQTITKTYAFTTFCFLATFLILSLPEKYKWQHALATLFIFAAVLTRLSALFFAVPLLLYLLWVSDYKNRIAIFCLAGLASLWVLFLIWANPEAVQWNLLTHHTEQWGNVSLSERFTEIFTTRLFYLLLSFPTYILLFLAILWFEYRANFANLRQMPVIAVMLLSAFFFVLPNLASGGFYTEYFVPALFVMFPLFSILYMHQYDRVSKYGRLTILTLFLLTLILGLLRDGPSYGGQSYIDTSGGQRPIEEIQQVADVVRQHSSPEDPLFVLEALWLAIEADRQALPDMTMAQFSYYDGELEQVAQFHLVNGEKSVSYINNRLAKIVILSRWDWHLFEQNGDAEQIRSALDQHYQLIFKTTEFGQHSEALELYIPQAGS